MAALSALRAVQDSRIVDALISAQQDSNSFVRSDAYRHLSDRKEQWAIPYLIAALQQDSPTGNTWASAPALRNINPAAKHLGLLRDQRAVEPLIEALSDPDEYLRSEASGALSRVGDSRTTGPLIARLRDHVGSVTFDVVEPGVPIAIADATIRVVSPDVNTLSDGELARLLRQDATNVISDLEAARHNFISSKRMMGKSRAPKNS